MTEWIGFLIRYRRFSRMSVQRKWALLVVVSVTVYCGSVLLLNMFSNRTLNLNENQLYSYVPATLLDHPNFAYDRKQKLPSVRLKTILLWNSWYSDKTYSFGTGHQPFLQADCPVSDCYIGNNLYAMPPSEYDAILFFFPMLVYVPFTYSRKSNQLYVFVNDNSPYEQENWGKITEFNHFFNLTMTYRRDSDIYWPHGSIDQAKNYRKNKPSQFNYAAGKSKLVAWLASNCKTASHREDYVSVLNKYVDVDVYGPCGNNSRQCTGGKETCYGFIERNYKFYLSFEDSLCRDYVTDEFFNILDRRIIPIVYGAANYSSLAPPGSFIDATQMGARRLAALLTKIDQDDRLYNEYFRWKGHGYRIKKRRQQTQQAFCELCQRLHQPKPQQIYSNFEAWWNDEHHCHQSNFTIPFKFAFIELNSVKPWVNKDTSASILMNRNHGHEK